MVDAEAARRKLNTALFIGLQDHMELKKIVGNILETDVTDPRYAGATAKLVRDGTFLCDVHCVHTRV